MDADHPCEWVPRDEADSWTTQGDGTRTRLIRKATVCKTCGSKRHSRRPRPPFKREVRAGEARPPPLPTPEILAVGRATLAVLRRRREPKLPAQSMLTSLARAGIPASRAEEELARFVQSDWVRLAWKASHNRWRLDLIEVLQIEQLEEFVEPGARAAREEALEEARTGLHLLGHPLAREVEEVILRGGGSHALDAETIRGLFALARHAETGEVLSERLFAARYLGNSKGLRTLGPRLERLVGPLDRWAIRDGPSVTLVGGRGSVVLPSQRIELESIGPFVGFGRDTVERLQEVRAPPNGAIVVENLTVFEACCEGTVEGAQDRLVVWSGGYPGRGVRRICELAAQAGSSISVWADLDLDGVKIFRLISGWKVGRVVPFRMSPSDVGEATTKMPLSSKSELSIRRELSLRPTAPLAETLEALLQFHSWVEQEALVEKREL